MPSLLTGVGRCHVHPEEPQCPAPRRTDARLPALPMCCPQDVHTLQSQALGTQIQFPFSSVQTETLSPTSYPYSSHFSTLSLSPGHYCLQWDSHDAPRRHQSALQPIPHPSIKLVQSMDGALVTVTLNFPGLCLPCGALVKPPGRGHGPDHTLCLMLSALLECQRGSPSAPHSLHSG